MASIAFGLCCLACVLLSLSLRRHYRQVFADDSRYERRKWILRWAGYATLAAAIWPSVRDSGPWIGLTLWISLFALAAFLQVMMLTYRPRGSGVLGGLGLVLIAIGLVP